MLASEKLLRLAGSGLQAFSLQLLPKSISALSPVSLYVSPEAPWDEGVPIFVFVPPGQLIW